VDTCIQHDKIWLTYTHTQSRYVSFMSACAALIQTHTSAFLYSPLKHYMAHTSCQYPYVTWVGWVGVSANIPTTHNECLTCAKPLLAFLADSLLQYTQVYTYNQPSCCLCMSVPQHSWKIT